MRDFDTANLLKHEERLQSIAEKILKHHSKATMEFKVTEQYRNMKEVLDKNPKIIAYAKQAYERAGLKLINEPYSRWHRWKPLKFYGFALSEYFYRHAGNT